VPAAGFTESYPEPVVVVLKRESGEGDAALPAPATERAREDGEHAAPTGGAGNPARRKRPGALLDRLGEPEEALVVLVV
jgi:hypothetical protein